MTEYIIMSPESTKKLYNILAGMNSIKLTKDGRFVYPSSLVVESDADFPTIYKQILQDPSNTVENIPDTNIRTDI